MSEQKASFPQCSNCDRKIGRLEQQFELNGEIVCAACAAALDAGADASGGDDIAPSADLTALASATTRRTGYRAPARKKKSSPTGLIAFGVGTLVLSAGLGFLYSNGTLSRWLGEQKNELSGVKAENELVAQYNTLISSGNELAQGRKYGEAAAKLREAKAIVDKNPKLPGASEGGELAITIAKYEMLAKGKAVAPQPAPTPAVVERAKPEPRKPDAGPAVDFMGSRSGPGAKPPQPAENPVENPVTAAPDTAPGDGGLPAVVEAPIGALPAPRPAIRPEVRPDPLPAPAADPAAASPAPDALADLSSNDPDKLASSGWDKMRGGDVGAAGELFKKSLQLAAGHEKSTVGQAVLPAFQQQPREAIARLEKLVAIRTARATAINLASLHLKENPMRAARVLRDHLAALKSPDEETVTYLGVALWQAEQKGSTTAAMKDFAAYYEQCEGKLAAAHPGKKRWGTEWLAAAEADRRKSSLVKQRGVLDAAEAEQRSTELRADRARQQLKDRSATLSRDALFALRQGVAEAEKVASDAKIVADKARADYDALDKPPLPDTIPIVEP